MILILLFVTMSYGHENPKPSAPPMNFEDFTEEERQKALDRLIREYDDKDEQERQRKQQMKEYREWQRTPMVEWKTFFMFIGLVFLVLFSWIYFKGNDDIIGFERLANSFGLSGMLTMFVMVLALILQTKAEF